MFTHYQKRLQQLGLVLTVILVALLGSTRLYADTATLNFKNADIHVVIETVANITGKNFVIDPAVKGKITVISSHSMDADEIYQVFLAVLSVHGYAAVPSGNVIQIVPSANAKQGSISTVTGRRTPSGNQIITRVIQINNVPAVQLVPILRPLLPQYAHLAAYQPTNTLIIADTAANVARIEKILRAIDQPSGADIEVVRLENAGAGEVVRILLAMEKPVPGAAAQARANTMIADDRTNSILLSGDRPWRIRMRALIAHLDIPTEGSGGNTHVVYLRYSKAKNLAKVLQDIGEAENKIKNKGQAAAGGSSLDFVIQADEETNALVITASPERYRSLLSVIRKLDVPRAQVMVEAIIAEVSSDSTEELGVQWAVDGSASGYAGGTNFSAGTGIVPLASGTVVPDGLTLGIGGVTGGGNDIVGVLQALQGNSGVNILSTPSLVTLDNEEAEIVVGENRPFVSGSYTSTGGGSTPTNPFQTVERQDVGLTLKVTPQINEGNAIKLEIEQEVSNVISGTEGDSYGPSTTKRSIKTVVMVEDGRLLVLGGLIDDQVQDAEQKVPGLGSIPILGWLFKYKKTTKVKRNLMIFLRPSILRDTQHSTVISSEKYNYMRLQQMQAQESMNKMRNNKDTPVMPSLDDKSMVLPKPYEEHKKEQEQQQDNNNKVE
jgi:general secretion pathway protein D